MIQSVITKNKITIKKQINVAHQGDLLPGWKPTSIAQNEVSGDQSRKADPGERSNYKGNIPKVPIEKLKRLAEQGEAPFMVFHFIKNSNNNKEITRFIYFSTQLYT